MERWGCREDPNRWQWGHLSGAIEQFQWESPVKYLGDAWMLAQALAEEHPLAGDDKAAALAAARVQPRGRWECTPESASHEPLAASAAHWERPVLAIVVRADGGGGARDPFVVGIAAGGDRRGRAPQRAAEGVDVEVLGGNQGCGILCCRPRVPGTKAGQEEWERVLGEVTAMGLEAPAARAPEGRVARVAARVGNVTQ